MSENTRSNQNRRRGGPMGGGPMGGMPIGEKAKNFKKSIGRLLRYLKPYYIMIIPALLLTAGGTVLSILAAGYMGNLTGEVGDVFDPRSPKFGLRIDMSAVSKFAVIVIIFYAVGTITHYVQTYIMATVSQGISRRLRTDISKKINKVPLKYYDKNSYGNVLSRVTNDVDTIGQTLNQSVASLVWASVTLIGVLIAMFVTCWQLALTAVISVPIGFALMSVIMLVSQKHFKAQQRNLGELNGQIEENYSAQTVVKAFNGEKKAEAQFEETNKKLFKSAFMSQSLSGLMFPLMMFVSNLGFVAIAAVGGALFVSGTIASVGVLTSFFIYVRLFQNPLGQIAQAGQQLQSTAAAAERVFEFLDVDEQESEAEKPARRIEDVKGHVEFKNVVFGYNEDKIIIKDFSAEVMPGQKVAIVGPTGAGKTTMVNLLMRFYELNGGQILIDGAPISEMRREDVRGMFGMVLQDTWLFDGTIRDNIVYSKTGVSEDEVVRACEAANIDHFIRTLPRGYDMALDDEVSISGGQRQLMTIARAMVQNSPMLILDEATSNVDTRTEQLIQDAMDKITKGRTSFVIAHRLSTIKNADMILVMRDGDIVESGSHEKLLEKGGFYSELYNSQFALNNG